MGEAKIGEVIEASTTEFMAECYQLYNAPPLGSLVKTTDGTVEIYSIVYNATTESIEPGRRPIARGKDEAEEEDIYLKNPQLVRLLRTEFNALVVGHRDAGYLHHYLPPRSARVHSFVYLCDRDELGQFTQSFDFLNILVSARIPGSGDELVAACLRHAAQAHDDSHAFLVRAGKELAILLSGELQRLNAILRRIKQ